MKTQVFGAIVGTPPSALETSVIVGAGKLILPMIAVVAVTGARVL